MLQFIVWKIKIFHNALQKKYLAMSYTMIHLTCNIKLACSKRFKITNVVLENTNVVLENTNVVIEITYRMFRL